MRHSVYTANFLPQRVSRTLGIFDLFLCVISNPRQALQEYSNITLFARIALVLRRQDEHGDKGLDYYHIIPYSRESHLFLRLQE